MVLTCAHMESLPQESYTTLDSPGRANKKVICQFGSGLFSLLQVFKTVRYEQQQQLHVINSTTGTLHSIYSCLINVQRVNSLVYLVTP